MVGEGGEAPSNNERKRAKPFLDFFRLCRWARIDAVTVPAVLPSSPPARNHNQQQSHQSMRVWHSWQQPPPADSHQPPQDDEQLRSILVLYDGKHARRDGPEAGQRGMVVLHHPTTGATTQRLSISVELVLPSTAPLPLVLEIVVLASARTIEVYSGAMDGALEYVQTSQQEQSAAAHWFEHRVVLAPPQLLSTFTLKLFSLVDRKSCSVASIEVHTAPQPKPCTVTETPAAFPPSMPTAAASLGAAAMPFDLSALLAAAASSSVTRVPPPMSSVEGGVSRQEVQLMIDTAVRAAEQRIMQALDSRIQALLHVISASTRPSSTTPTTSFVPQPPQPPSQAPAESECEAATDSLGLGSDTTAPST